MLSIYECASFNASVYNEGEESYRGLCGFPKTPNLLIIDEEIKLQADVVAITVWQFLQGNVYKFRSLVLSTFS